ncbi:cytochrome c biogenesis protein CcsA [Alistipes sp.]|uniref:cytochrome c biogenesis protein CcsA n=1 Tax=Alistipes sp. TaxID=1872444 RepID=UPI003AF1A0FA
MTTIGWEQFTAFGVVSAALWCLGACLTLGRGRSASPQPPAPTRLQRSGSGLFAAGTLVFGAFILLFWISAGRPPMRTMGETRLWYSLFIAATGWVLYLRWRYRFLLPFAALLASVFAGINIFKPEIHDATLMPALQSAWFIPHVAVYMLSYAVLAAALAVAVGAQFGRPQLMEPADRLVRIGASLLILGMLMGAVWARQAWGDYWAWDAKESWAAATWLMTLVYIHFRKRYPRRIGWAAVVLAAAFVALQITWYGIGWMPAAKKSLHTYTTT